MITQNLINKTAQRVYDIINHIENYLDENKLTLPLNEYELLLKIRDDNRYFLIFLESVTREKKIERLSFENDLSPIITNCKLIERLFNLD